MADAYGGQAKGHLRRPGIKYQDDRLRNAKKFVVNEDEEPIIKAELARLAKSVTGFEPPRKEPIKQTLIGSMANLSIDSLNEPGPTSGRHDSNYPNTGKYKPKGKDADQIQAMRDRGKQPVDKKNDFKKVFGKPLDEFLNDPEWEKTDSMSNASSRRSRALSNRSN